MTYEHLDRKVKSCMTPLKTVVLEHQTIDEAIAVLRNKDIYEKVLYFYVIDEEGRLKGLVSTRNLLLKKSNTKIADITEPHVIALNENQTVHEAMEVMETQRLLALPVVDEHNRLVGSIDVGVYIEESVDVAHAKKRLQIFQMLGVIIEEGRPFSTLYTYRNRMPWILCTIIGGLSCAAISRIFENILQQIIILAMFIPLVLSLSESISMQSMTQSLNQTNLKFNLKGLLKQCKLYVLLSVTCSVIVGSLSIFWGDGYEPAIIISGGILISIVISALIGAAIPFALHRLKLDPKVAAGPVVLMLADVVTTTIYFLIASFIIHAEHV
ncbi:MAG: magnesium transporter [Simkaniaceae bacterium]|nr:magnesium transporter [Simkaniaceae bacterium]